MCSIVYQATTIPRANIIIKTSTIQNTQLLYASRFQMYTHKISLYCALRALANSYLALLFALVIARLA